MNTTNETLSTVPMNQWIDLLSLTLEQLEALQQGDFNWEWNHTVVRCREVMEVKITPTQSL